MLFYITCQHWVKPVCKQNCSLGNQIQAVMYEVSELLETVVQCFDKAPYNSNMPWYFFESIQAPFQKNMIFKDIFKLAVSMETCLFVNAKVATTGMFTPPYNHFGSWNHRRRPAAIHCTCQYIIRIKTWHFAGKLWEDG